MLKKGTKKLAGFSSSQFSENKNFLNGAALQTHAKLKAHTRNTAFCTNNDYTIQHPQKPASHQYWGQIITTPSFE
jgi:hypothetical protein